MPADIRKQAIGILRHYPAGMQLKNQARRECSEADLAEINGDIEENMWQDVPRSLVERVMRL